MIKEKLIFHLAGYDFGKYIYTKVLKTKTEGFRATIVKTYVQNISQDKINIHLSNLTLIKNNGLQISLVPSPFLMEGSFNNGEIFPAASVYSEWIFYHNQLAVVEPGDKFILTTSKGDFEFISEKKSGGFWGNFRQ